MALIPIKLPSVRGIAIAQMAVTTTNLPLVVGCCVHMAATIFVVLLATVRLSWRPVGQTTALDATTAWGIATTAWGITTSRALAGEDEPPIVISRWFHRVSRSFNTVEVIRAHIEVAGTGVR
jgi:hypothetical protein